MIKISIARDYTDSPGGRFITDGDYSGEEFRKKFLVPAMEKAILNNEDIVIDLDGCFGYPSSFINEAFAGLAKIYGKERVKEKLQFISLDQPSLIGKIINEIEEIN